MQLLRRRVTVISQDPTLFKGSLRFNLDPFRRLSDQAIESLLIRAGLQDILNREVEGEDEKESEVHPDDETSRNDSVVSAEKEVNNFIPSRTGSAASNNKKVKGIYFQIAENGSNLSAGEKQLICICRAVLRKNKIVVLDEATANIDIVTEKKI